jgi:flap endonuclease-1
MGIKYLNKFIQTHCSDSVKQIHLSDLSNKKIVIDTSIYLYRYVADNTLLENFYLMISVFRKYNIIPLFVFDGKPPQEKLDLLKKRKQNKQLAEASYNNLKDSLDGVMDDTDKTDIIMKMDCLKKEFVKIHHTDISNVKLLLQAYGVSYVDAPGEADKLCAKMVCKNKAYACLSEDMDLFVYGCTRVLRYLSLFKTQVVMYDMKGILNDLQLTLDEFKQICIVSGTDYNIDNDKINLYQSLKYFKKYKKYTNAKNIDATDINFFGWLEHNTDCITNICDLYNIIMLFDLKMMDDYKKYENMKIINGPVNLSNLINIMEQEQFIFVDT